MLGKKLMNFLSRTGDLGDTVSSINRTVPDSITKQSGHGNWVDHLYGKYTTAGVSASNVEKTIDANKALSEYQYMKDQEQLEYMNQYNAPAMQKQRLIEAGLNPALMYQSAPQNVQTQMPKYNAIPQDYTSRKAIDLRNPLQLLAQGQDIRLQTAQVNNLLAQRENIEMDTLLKAATKGKQIGDTAKTAFDLELSKEIKEYSLEMARENAWKRSEERVNEAARNQGIHADNRNKNLEYQLRKADLRLRDQGIYPGDPVYVKMLMQMLSKFGIKLTP